MSKRSIVIVLLFTALLPLFSCADGNPNEFTGPDPIGVWRYQTGQMAYKDGPALHFTDCSGLDGQLKLRSDGTWSEWRSLDAMMFPHSGTYTIAEGVISFYKSNGDLFESAAFSVDGDRMNLDIDNPAFQAKCVLSRE